MKKLYTTTFYCYISLLLTAQSVQNVHFEQVGQEVAIYYDLIASSTTQTFTVELQVSENGGYTYSDPLQKVAGAVGYRITAGQGKRIIWRVLQERKKIIGNNITFKVTATPNKPLPKNMVWVEGGTFQMGDIFEEGDSDEMVHTVSVSGFYMDKYEVTFERYDAFCKATGHTKPSDISWGRGKRPVINVSWYDAIAFCNWRSQREGLTPCYTIDKSNKDPNNKNVDDNIKWTVTCNWSANGYRLPTEAEWEYAARERGKKVRFGNGQNIANPSELNFYSKESVKTTYSKVGIYRGKTLPVGSFHPNTLGLYDMSGNVMEWCWDWYDTYPTNSISKPKGSSSGCSRIVRSGSLGDNSYYCRSANRYYYSPNLQNYNLGFRCIKVK